MELSNIEWIQRIQDHRRKLNNKLPKSAALQEKEARELIESKVYRYASEEEKKHMRDIAKNRKLTRWIQ